MDFLVAHFVEIVFYALGALAVLGGVGVIVLRSPVHSALCLLWTFLMVAALFVLRHAEFLAAVQVLVYGGGIMVLFLFVIMLVNVKRLAADSTFVANLAPVAVAAGVLIGALMALFLMLGAMATGDGDLSALRAVEGAELGNTEAVGWLLYQKYLVPFEVVSVVLLVAMIGAIIFGRSDPALRAAKGGTEL